MSDLSKLQLLFGLCVAKFMSEKEEEVCLSDGVNDCIMKILSAKYKDEFIKSTIDGYRTSNIPDETLTRVISIAMTRLVEASVVQMFDTDFETQARRACLPYQLADDQFETLKSLVKEAVSKGEPT